MSRINVNISDVINENKKLKMEIIRIERIKRGVKLLKWRFPEIVELTPKQQDLYDEIWREFNRIQDEVQSMYDFVEVAAEEYKAVEQYATKNVNDIKFI